MDRRTVTTLRGGLDINFLFWIDVQNNDHVSYDALLGMLRPKIINEELKDHRKRANENFYLHKCKGGEVSPPI